MIIWMAWNTYYFTNRLDDVVAHLHNTPIRSTISRTSENCMCVATMTFPDAAKWIQAKDFSIRRAP